MSAYAALVSVLRLLETIHRSGGREVIHIRPQLRSLHEKATFLLDFLEFSITACKGGRTSAIVAKMRSPACAAEDALKRQMSRIMRSRRVRKPRDGLAVSIYMLCASFSLGFFADGLIYPDVVPVLAAAALSTVFAVIYGHLAVYADNRFREVRALEKLEIELFDRVLEDLKIVEEELAIINQAGGDPDISANRALISLLQILDSILDSGGRRISRDRANLDALRDKVSSLMDFLRNDPTIKISEMEIIDANIIRAAYKAKSLIRVLVPNRFDPSLDWMAFYTDLNMSLKAKMPRLPLVAMLITLSLGYCNYYGSRFPLWIRMLVLFFLALTVACVLLVLEVTGVFLYTTVWPAIRNYKMREIKDLPLVIGDFSIVKVRNVTSDATGKPSELPAVSSSSSSSSSSSAAAAKGSFVGRDAVVGLESNTHEIIERLLNNSSSREFTSIVGMGGSGKTTLARQVYQDPHIASHFDLCAWVTISEEYSFRHVLLCLLDSLRILTDDMRLDSEEDLAVQLYQHLTGRRYLLVIDDVWDTKILDFLSRFFPYYDNGSRILVTTRLSGVANYLSHSWNHYMPLLNDDDSWNLLRTKVFGEEGCPSELEPIGREIAKRCQGLPLAIHAIRPLLSRDIRRDTWSNIAEHLNLNLRQSNEQCLEILELSYNHMPHHLRPCFLYMGSFPRNSEIHVSRLINLWTAEDFLKPSTSKTSEEVAEDNLNDLIDRNLISVGRRSCNGKIRTCSIHSLLRDVSVLKACEENFLDAVDSERPNELQRRVSMHVDGRPIKRCGQSVRSFLFSASALLQGYNASDHYLDLVDLRVLDLLAGVHFAEFPDQIIRLDHLKFLAFHCDGPLPPSIWKLQDLETIVHQHCSSHGYHLLPVEIWSMPNLRHLYMKPDCYLSTPARYCLPSNKSVVLEHLQTLTGITNFKWTGGIIRKIPNLKKLGISYDVSSSVDWQDYGLESLVDLHQLETLRIIIKYNDSVVSDNYPDPPELAFPQELKKLSLSGCRVPWESMTTIGALPNLEALKLRCEACSGTSWVTVEDEFPRLMFLLLEEISFTTWESEESHFPRLQRLVIRSCRMLEEIPLAIGDIPTLEMIKLVDCHPSAVESAQQIQEEQEEMGNDGLELYIE